MSKYRVIHGDCLDVLRSMPSDSVDSIVTDPPYGLSFMGKRWDYDIPSVEVWVECLRVLKPGGHLLAFAGTRTQHRMACRIEDAGFEIRDMLAWVYGSGFPKSLDVSKAIDKAERGVPQGGADPTSPNHGKFKGGCSDDNPTGRGFGAGPGAFMVEAGERADRELVPQAQAWDGWGTALKPSHEPLTWATKPLTSVPHDAIVLAEQAIGSLICLSLSHAKHAETLLRSSRREFGEGVASALLIAAVHRGLSSADPSEVTAMFKSPETARTILSIAESWSAILGAYSEHRNTFTTSTAIGLTTALRTFACLTLQTIADSITPDGERMLGQLLSAPIAEVDLSDTSVRQAKSTSVRGLVSLLTGRSVASVAEASFMPAARTGSSVLRDAITTLGERTRPSLEPITLARKPLIGTVAANVLTHGTGALNIDGCRVPGNVVEERGDAWGKSGKGKSRAWHGTEYEETKTAAERTSQLGRFPANFLHDGSDEVSECFPKSKDGVAGKRSGVNNIYSGSWGAINEKQGGYGGEGSAARFFYCAKANKKDREEGCEELDDSKLALTQGKRCAACGKWDRPNSQCQCEEPQWEEIKGRKNFHPTVKPVELGRYLCRLITPPNGVVLDPFAGSGSIGKAALLEGFRFVGIEKEAEYIPIMEARLKHAERTTSSGMDDVFD